MEIASWRGAKTSDELKFSTHFSASFADMESESIAPTHISGRRDAVMISQGGDNKDYHRSFCLTKCSQSVPRKYWNSVDEKRVALRLAQILKVPANRHRACSAVAWQARHCSSPRYECTKFALTRDAKVTRARLINESFRELHMTTSGKPPKRQTYSSVLA